MRTDRIFGLTVAGLSLLFITVAVPGIVVEWETGAGAGYYTVSPRLFPLVAGALCLVFGLLIALKPDGRNLLGVLKHAPARRYVGLTIGIATGYAIALGLLGFVLSSVLALIAFFIGFGERRWFLIAVLAVGVPLIIEYAFARLFLLELPAGRLGLPF